MRRRPAFALPYADQVPGLASLLAPGAGLSSELAATERFTTAAAYHGVLGFVLAAAEEERLAIPEAARARVAAVAAMEAVRGRLLRRELPGVLRALEAGCAARPLLVKGPAVADRYYPQPFLRRFSDLDFLVPHDRLGAAVDALRDEGFEALLEFRPGYAERHGHDVHAVKQPGRTRIDVEVHWRIGDDPATAGVDYAFASAGADRLEVAGTRVPVARSPRQLLILAVHLLSDRHKRLIWINDLALIAKAASASEWEEAFVDAEDLQLGWVLHRALDYAVHHLGFVRARPREAGRPPAFGPLRAVEELDARAAPHIGRLVAMSWRERPGYLRAVLIPTRAGLEGTVGGDGAATWRLAARHATRALRGLRPSGGD